MFAEQAFRQLLKDYTQDEVLGIIEQTRAAYLGNMKKLLRAIDVPLVLLWFSNDRTPDYELRTESLRGIFGGFPHLVTRTMVEDLKQEVSLYIECVYRQDREHVLENRFTGEEVQITLPLGKRSSRNTYYPTPDMHAKVAQRLAEALRPLVH
jgi:hypothetical protein